MFWYKMLSQGLEVNEWEVLHTFFKSLKAMKDIHFKIYCCFWLFFWGGGVVVVKKLCIKSISMC